MRILIGLASLLILINACNTADHTAELNEIKDLENSIDSSEMRILDLDTSVIYSRLNRQVNDLNIIQSSLDSIPRPQAFVLDQYNSYKKAYSKWGDKIPVFFKEIELRRGQLEDLTKDIENDMLQKDSIRIYIDKEADYIMALDNIVRQMELGINSIDSMYIYSQKRIDTIITNIKNDSVR